MRLDELNVPEQPYRRVRKGYVNSYARAMRTGETFPPILIDQHNTIIDGRHRYEACLKVFEPNHRVKTERAMFSDDAERLTEFARRNRQHGFRLAGFDRRVVMLRMENEGVSLEEMKEALCMEDSQLKRHLGFYVEIPGDPPEWSPTGNKIPLKHGAERLAGQTVTREYAKQHFTSHQAGNIASRARQLTNDLRQGHLLDRNDPNEMRALTTLYETLETVLNQTAAAR